MGSLNAAYVLLAMKKQFNLVGTFRNHTLALEVVSTLESLKSAKHAQKNGNS